MAQQQQQHQQQRQQQQQQQRQSFQQQQPRPQQYVQQYPQQYSQQQHQMMEQPPRRGPSPNPSRSHSRNRSPRSRSRRHPWYVVSHEVAFCLALMELGIILLCIVGAYFLYPLIAEIEVDREREQWQVFFWILLMSSFWATLGTIGWAYGVRTGQIDFYFWPWILFSLVEFVLLCCVFGGVLFKHKTEVRVLVIPLVLFFLPLLASICYYQKYHNFEPTL